MKIACVILAAGLGTRMNSTVPKVLHKVSGIPMLQSVIRAAEKIRPDKIVVVAGTHIDLIERAIGSKKVSLALQDKAEGTGHALRCARPVLKNFTGIIVVLNGDSPLVNPDSLKKFLKLHRKGKDMLSVLSFIAENPGSYGRILRNASGEVLSIIENKDADSEQKKIKEVNSGVYAMRHDVLNLLNSIERNRLKGEYYLTDIVALASQRGLRTSSYCIGSEEEFLGVNTMTELYRASLLMQRKIIQKWINRGVTFLNAASVFIHPDAFLGKETTIYPNVCIEGPVKIGAGSTIYPNVRIQNSTIGKSVIVKDSTVIVDSVIRDRATVGPFAHIRPGSDVGTAARIGNFVELKKARIGNNSKASHLSYLGDTIIGKDVNIGAGTITCNYDGEKKHISEIMDEVFVGSDSQIVAPVTVGKGAYIGAGSTITKDVPAYSLAVSRVEQKHILDWVKKRQAKKRNQNLKSRNKKEKKSGR